MAITFVNYNQEDLASSNTATCVKPTDTADGDIMFAVVITAGNYPNTIPGGWTKIAESNPGLYYQLYYKIALSEGASYTWGTAANNLFSVTISTYRGEFNSSNPINTFSNTQYTTSNTSVLAASMTTTVVNCPLFYFGNFYNTSARTFTKPTAPTTDWVEDVDRNTASSDINREVCHMIWTSSGATGDISATCSTSGTSKHAFAVALNPAPTGPANLKTYNTNTKTNIKSINTNLIANVKSLDTNA